MVTIKQVAKEAGLSKSTVSRYISQKGYVSEEARDRIKAAIEKLHYSPNLSAQSLKTKKNQLVGLLLPDISNPFSLAWLEGLRPFEGKGLLSHAGKSLRQSSLGGGVS